MTSTIFTKKAEIIKYYHICINLIAAQRKILLKRRIFSTIYLISANNFHLINFEIKFSKIYKY